MKKYFTLTSIIQFIIAFALGAGTFYFLNTPVPNFSVIPLRSPADPTHQLINPLIGFDVLGEGYFKEFDGLKSNLQDYVDTQKKAGTLSDIGIYVRTLPNGHWFGINENAKFFPASLFKIPIALAYFKKAEDDDSILRQQLRFKGQSSPSTPQPASDLIAGKTYSVQDLIEKMLVGSDNNAKDLLLNAMDVQYLNEVFSDLNLTFPGNETYEISPKQYGTFFRRLYNSTFLGRDYSEQVLELLSKATYKNGLATGVPRDIRVAHKYGENGSYENGVLQTAELHDCGIVYTKNSYFICVMTKGYTFQNLQEIIQKISKTTYESLN